MFSPFQSCRETPTNYQPTVFHLYLNEKKKRKKKETGKKERRELRLLSERWKLIRFERARIFHRVHRVWMHARVKIYAETLNLWTHPANCQQYTTGPRAAPHWIETSLDRPMRILSPPNAPRWISSFPGSLPRWKHRYVTVTGTCSD